jgi:hypothetical protein
VGDGSTKYLNTNRSCTIGEQNNNHLALYGTVFQASGIAYYIGALNHHFGLYAGQLFSRNMSIDAPNRPVPVPSSLAGIARNNSSQFITYTNSGSSTVNVSSGVPNANPVMVFTANNTGVPDVCSTSRFAFYSIGESLDLALLDARVTALIAAYGAAIP